MLIFFAFSFFLICVLENLQANEGHVSINSNAESNWAEKALGTQQCWSQEFS